MQMEPISLKELTGTSYHSELLTEDYGRRLLRERNIISSV